MGPRAVNLPPLDEPVEHFFIELLLRDWENGYSAVNFGPSRHPRLI
jgi:hypothetical protein